MILRLDRVTRMISNATIGTAIVLVHGAMADRFETRRRDANRLGIRLPDASRDARE